MPQENMFRFVLIRLFHRLVTYVHAHLLNVERLFNPKKVIKILKLSRTEQSDVTPESMDL